MSHVSYVFLLVHGFSLEGKDQMDLSLSINSEEDHCTNKLADDHGLQRM